MTVRPITARCRGILVRHWSSTSRTLPGPRALPLLGHAHLFSPVGPYTADRLVDAHADLHRRFGPVVGVHLGIPMVLLFNPDDVATLFHSDDRWPQRPLFDALRHYRRSKPARYKHLGLVTDNGEGWHVLRRPVNWLLRPPALQAYFAPQSQVAEDFVRRLVDMLDAQGRIHDFVQVATQYSQEAVGVVCFGERLGCLEEQPNSTVAWVSETNHAFLEAMARSLLGLPWWKIWRTPTYRKLARCEDFMWRLCADFVSAAERRLAADPSYGQRIPFLAYLLTESKLDPRDVTLIMAEVFFGGIDATATTLSLALFHLARHPETQDRLLQEIRATGDLGRLQDLHKMKYLRACLKETLRLTPTAVGSGRILSSDLPLKSGHCVPANTLLIACHPVMCRQAAIFPDPLHFRPERWLRGGPDPLPHPFASMPFGFGPRMCPGRRLAEQEVQLALVKLISRFRVQNVGPSEDIRLQMRLNLIPDRPLTFRFEVR